MKRILFSYFLIFAVQPCLADNLDAYRSKFIAPELTKATQAKSLERVGKIDALLSTRAFLVDSKNPEIHNLRTNNATNRMRKTTNGMLLTFIEEGVKQLSSEARYSIPMEFDPSMYTEDIEAKQKSRMGKVCRPYFNAPYGKSTRFEALVGEYAALLDSKTDKQGTNDSQAGKKPSPIKFATIAALNSSSTSYPSIDKSLGNIIDVEYVDGVISHLVFDGVDKKAMRISLDSLISIRTGDDAFFITMLGCFSDMVKEGIEKKTPANLLAHMKSLSPSLDAYIDGAKRINTKVSIMGDSNLDGLISLLLNIRGTDIPLSDELIGGERPDATSINLAPHFEALVVAKDLLISKKAIDDLYYYRGLENNLNRLEYFLKEHSDLKAQTKVIVDEIRAEAK